MKSSFWRGFAALLVGPALLLVACGDDDGDDTATATTAAEESNGEGEDSEYCDLARELDEQEDFPSEEQLQQYADLAPEEISEEAAVVAEAFEGASEENIGEIFGDPDVAEAIEAIEAHDAEVCGIGDGDEAAELPEGVSTEVDEDAARVDVEPVEEGDGESRTYGWDFEAPDAGPTSFVFENTGEEAHFMYIVKLAEGVTIEETLEADDTEGLAELEAESEVAASGQEAVLTFEDLEAGEYAIYCFIPGPTGEPHAFNGMAEEFTVS